jgi:hypothetical protein
LEYWSQSKYLNNQFAQFGVDPSGASTGIWRDDDGRERIVYLYDEERWGDVIAESFLDYLRILAIGYDDVNESCNLDIQTYNKLCEREDLNTGHSPAFKDWVEKEFNTTVPAAGNEVFIKERNKFNDWLNKSIRKKGTEYLSEYSLFEQIGKDLRTSWLYTKLFLSLPLGKVSKTYFTFKNYYGIKAILNEDYSIRYLILGGNNPKLNPFSYLNPAGLEITDTREVVEKTLGKPIKKGQEDKCEYYLYEINSKFGLRTVQIFFNPNKENDK